jgi:hypothetical protein
VQKMACKIDSILKIPFACFERLLHTSGFIN